MNQHQYYYTNKKAKIINLHKQYSKIQNINHLYISIKKIKQQIYNQLENQESPHYYQQNIRNDQKNNEEQKKQKDDDNNDIQSQQMLARGNLKQQYFSYETQGIKRYIYRPYSINSRKYIQKQSKSSINQTNKDKKLLSQQKPSVNISQLGDHRSLMIYNNKTIQDNDLQSFPSYIKYSKDKDQQFKKMHPIRCFTQIDQERLPIINNKISRHQTLAVRKDQGYNNCMTKNIDQNRYIIKQFIQLTNDLKRFTKSNQRIQKLVKILQQFNPFFRKIQRIIGVSLLNISEIQMKYVGNALYQIDQIYDHFYIILYGQVRLIGRNDSQKIRKTGQTILQQILQRKNHKLLRSKSNQNAKITKQSWLLCIKRKDYQDLELNLLKYGFKRGLQQLKNLVERNRVAKQNIRNKIKSVIK